MKKVMLITGSAQRIGAFIAQAAHADSYDIVLHYRHSLKQTQDLMKQLNEKRANSCIKVMADFDKDDSFSKLVNTIKQHFKRLDVLVNNASEFFPTHLDKLQIDQYHSLFNSNVKGPLFLAKACYPLLKSSAGNIINLVDIHADKPLKNYPVYSMAKAANKMMVKALAKEYAPHIRVNGISPGCIILPNDDSMNKNKQQILARTALKRQGNEKNIYQCIRFLIENNYLTGETINVDGGRRLNM